MPPSEARQRFVNAVNIRVNNALIEIAKISKLHSPRYEYGQDDIEKIVSALDEAVADVRLMLETRGKGREIRQTIIE